MIETVFALLLSLNGQVIEHTYKETLSDIGYTREELGEISMQEKSEKKLQLVKSRNKY